MALSRDFESRTVCFKVQNDGTAQTEAQLMTVSWPPWHIGHAYTTTK